MISDGYGRAATDTGADGSPAGASAADPAGRRDAEAMTVQPAAIGGWVLVAATIVSGLLCVWSILQHAGLWSAIAAALIIPLVALIAPVPIGLMLGEWLPALVMYGGAALAAALIAYGRLAER